MRLDKKRDSALRRALAEKRSDREFFRKILRIARLTALHGLFMLHMFPPDRQTMQDVSNIFNPAA